MLEIILLISLAAIVVAIASQNTKFIFTRALKSPSKVKIKDELLYKFLDDERIILIIERVLISKNYPIITSDISRAMYSVSPIIAKIYANLVGTETKIAVKSANDMLKKYLQDVEEAKLGEELVRIGINTKVNKAVIPTPETPIDTERQQ